MSEVTVREFSRNPSAFFALAERGETVTVTKHGHPIAMVVPTSGPLGRYAPLVAEGRLRLSPFTVEDILKFPRHKTEGEGIPIETILKMRELDDEWEARLDERLGGGTDRDLHGRQRSDHAGGRSC